MANTLVPPRVEITGTDNDNDNDNASFNGLYRSVSGLNAEAHGAEEKFDKLADQAMGLNNKISNLKNSTLYQDAIAVKQANPGQVVSKSVATISKFAENSAVIMKGLDAVKGLHPFVGIVVFAFQAAIELELTRRDNDKKVLALKTDMMNMMEILLDLKDMKDAQKLDPDGTTLEGRMQRIVKVVEQDIRDCSATCEAYIKKKFLVKLFDGSRWDGRLAAFSDTFSKRKAEFSLALSIRTSLGVDNVQHTLVHIEASIKTGSDSAAMLSLFHQLESPMERELRKWIEDKGGPQVVSDNEKLFKELQSKMKNLKATNLKTTIHEKDKSETTESMMLAVRQEMREDIDKSLARDRHQFDRKFDAFQDKLEEMKNTVRRSTDRLIAVVTGGPHERIRDIDLFKLWRDMAWRGNVKARHFVVGVQDYFLQKYSKEDQEIDEIRSVAEGISRAASPTMGISRPASPALSMGTAATDDSEAPNAMVTRALEERTAERDLEDRWAIEYITLARVRSILEAFDDDGSGWISVLEANHFTSSRPLNYTVVKWIAFWAAGFTSLCARYAKAIENVRARMVAIAADVLPSNRARVDKYMCSYSLQVFDFIVRVVAADYNEDEALMSHLYCASFPLCSEILIKSSSTDYIDSEEARLTKGLEHFGWQIDAQNTLQLISGTGRIECHLFPLIHLLLERHSQIIQLACKFALDDQELWDAECSIYTLADAIRLRILTLESQFKTHNLNPANEFEVAYNGMFKTAYLYLNGDRAVSNWEYPESYYPSDEEPDEKILRHQTIELGVPDFMYRDISQDDEVPTHPFTGLWTGTYKYGESTRMDGLVSAHLRFLDDEDQNGFAGSGRDTIGVFEIFGNLTPLDSSTRQIWFKKDYAQVKDEPKNLWAYRGTVSVEDSGWMYVMSGEWGPWVDDPTTFTPYGTFQMDRTPAIAARHRPSVAEFEDNTARARWKLALNVVEEQVRRKLLNWNHYRQRRDERKKFVEASLHVFSMTDPMRYRRIWTSGDDTDYSLFGGYWKTLNELQSCLRPEDIQFYQWISNARLQRECFHPNKTCDSCGEQIIGAAYKCLECTVPSDPGDGVDLCENCKDNSAVVANKNLNHIPTAHVLLKTLRVIYPEESWTDLAN
ncbi:hypothetical protein B0H11DRAFT_1360059 [Mycena galericulata]|nr:hypothetical protein B0H11DRAFT_1360059 [Mycena galericulata]